MSAHGEVGTQNGVGAVDQLWDQFLVQDDVLAARMAALLPKMIRFCRIDARGHVQILASDLSAKEKIILVAAARAIASRRSSDITEEVSVAELAQATGLRKNQVSARCHE